MITITQVENDNNECGSETERGRIVDVVRDHKALRNAHTCSMKAIMCLI